MRSSRVRLVACSAVLGLAGLALVVPPSVAARPASNTDGAVRLGVSSGRLAPEGAGALARRDSTTAKQRSAIAMKLMDRRDTMANRLGSTEAAPGAAQGPKGQQTRQAAESDALQVRRNNKNTRASSVGSTLTEPSAANDGNQVFYSGNTFSSSSGNNGSTWAAVSIAAGPSDAPSACCDLDVIRAHSRDRTFSSVLYTNAAVTNGVIRISVRSNQQGSPLCSYLIDPGGTANNVLPDYPHLGLSSGFLYLSTNNLTNGNSWTGAQVRRFNLTQMSACQTTSTNTFNWTGGVGQRILTPVEGATSVMYFGSNESATSFRAFSWAESSTSLTTVTRTVGSSTFANPDCRGGTGNFDFIERSTAWSITGFRLRGATGGGRVTFWWPVAADANHPQAHLHGASLRTSDLALLAQPPVWSSTTCFGYPAVASNSSGDYGMSMAVGGKAGGSGTAAQGAVLVDDSSSSGIFFPTFSVTASGTHNRSDSRYGDYFTVRTNARCTSNWVGTNYALLNGTSTSNVNARYVEFQSSTRAAC